VHDIHGALVSIRTVAGDVYAPFQWVAFIKGAAVAVVTVNRHVRAHRLAIHVAAHVPGAKVSIVASGGMLTFSRVWIAVIVGAQVAVGTILRHVGAPFLRIRVQRTLYFIHRAFVAVVAIDVRVEALTCLGIAGVYCAAVAVVAIDGSICAACQWLAHVDRAKIVVVAIALVDALPRQGVARIIGAGVLVIAILRLVSACSPQDADVIRTMIAVVAIKGVDAHPGGRLTYVTGQRVAIVAVNRLVYASHCAGHYASGRGIYGTQIAVAAVNRNVLALPRVHIAVVEGVAVAVVAILRVVNALAGKRMTHIFRARIPVVAVPIGILVDLAVAVFIRQVAQLRCAGVDVWFVVVAVTHGIASHAQRLI